MKWKGIEFMSQVWHPWFAWYPVTIGKNTAWLEWVERKDTPGAYGINYILRFPADSLGVNFLPEDNE